MEFGVFYAIALYFSCIWGLFFYYLFKTPQVSIKNTISIFFLTQLFVFVAWDVLGIPRINPFYRLIDLSFPLNLFGYTLGVGLMEELAKAIPLFVIYRKQRTVIATDISILWLNVRYCFWRFEGVQYQMEVNTQLDYTGAFL